MSYINAIYIHMKNIYRYIYEICIYIEDEVASNISFDVISATASHRIMGVLMALQPKRGNIVQSPINNF